MNKGLRIFNFVIDSICIQVAYAIISIFFYPYYLNLIVFLTYYFFFEYFLGQTPGKMVTSTVVVDLNYTKPSLRKVLYRSVLRFNPLDAFSYLFGLEQGSHDLPSKTRLVYKKNQIPKESL